MLLELATFELELSLVAVGVGCGLSDVSGDADGDGAGEGAARVTLACRDGTCDGRVMTYANEATIRSSPMTCAGLISNLAKTDFTSNHPPVTDVTYRSLYSPKNHEQGQAPLSGIHEKTAESHGNF